MLVGDDKPYPTIGVQVLQQVDCKADPGTLAGDHWRLDKLALAQRKGMAAVYGCKAFIGLVPAGK